ncbi:hypothetical protein NT6N_14160 [Oceaniferula spumae]|uniref:DNA recombination protein RmuC n=1 Tax=Oceaniferula spumae TaxID=2979115 RepID=A0AAT9FKB3_9BACT
MDTFVNIVSQPFTWGLLVGLFLVIMTWKLMRKDVAMLRSENARISTENKELQGHLNTQLKINSKGNEQLQTQLDELREQNENLRVNLNTVGQKAGRAEMRQLHLMETAVTVMREQAPGFAPAWERAMRDAENTHEAAQGGLKKLMRKVLPGGMSVPAIESRDDSEHEEA